MRYTNPRLLYFTLLHSGQEVESNTVDFVESRQSRPCRFVSVHTGDNVERTFDIRPTKSTELATMLTATSCRIQVVADLLPKPATKSTVSATVDFVASVYRALDYYRALHSDIGHN